MVQIGNFHFGKSNTAQSPQLNVGEAYILWDHLIARYLIIQQTQIYLNFTHDPDLKLLIETGLTQILEKEVNVLENLLNKFKIPLPKRPPKSVNLENLCEVFTDEFIFNEIFFGIQGFLDNHVRTVRAMTTNDNLRSQAIDYLKKELDLFDDLCKYGKLKGYLAQPPSYKQN